MSSSFHEFGCDWYHNKLVFEFGAGAQKSINYHHICFIVIKVVFHPMGLNDYIFFTDC